MELGILLPVVLVFGVIAAVIFMAGSGVLERQMVRESLKQLDGYDMEPVVSAEHDPRAALLSQSAISRILVPGASKLTSLGKRFTPVGYVDKVRKKFVYAGVSTPDSVDRFLATKAIVTPVGIILGLANLFVGFIPLSGFMGIVASLVLGGGIAMAPDLGLNRKVEERQHTIQRTLPDVMDLLTISVEAGLGFEQALDRVIDNVPGPLSDEFYRMLGEARSGTSRADAMRSMEARCDVAELRSFVLAIIQADTFGVSIGRVLRAQSDEMRIKRRQLAHEQAQKAPVKMLIPMVFCIFPALFVVVLGPAALNIANSDL